MTSVDLETIPPRPRKAERDRSAPMRNLGDAWSYYLPLALTMLMMSGSTPFVNSGISRLENPVSQLAAFAVAFTISIFFSSLTFGFETTAVALIRGRNSFKKVWLAATITGGTLGLIELLFVFSPLQYLVFHDLFNLSPESAESARWALLLFSPLPLLISWRGVFRGVFSYTGHTSMVGYGTFLRLVTMAVTIIGGVWADIPGALMGAAAFLFSIIAEAAFVGLNVRARLGDLRDVEESEHVRSLGRIFRFALPFLMSILVGTTSGLLINLVLSRTQNPEPALATFSMLRSVTWFLSSVLMSSQTLAIARTRSPEETAVVIRFLALIALFFTFVFLAISFEPLSSVVFGTLLGATDEVLDHCLILAIWFVPTPLLVAFRMYFRGLLVREGRTTSTLASSIAGVTLMFAMGVWLADAFTLPATVGVLMWLVLNGAELVTLVLLLRLRPATRKPASETTGEP